MMKNVSLICLLAVVACVSAKFLDVGAKATCPAVDPMDRTIMLPHENNCEYVDYRTISKMINKHNWMSILKRMLII